MFCGACVIILGSVIAASSNKMAQLVVGRFILGAGIQIMTVAAPAYAVEISPPHWRGRCVGKTSPASLSVIPPNTDELTLSQDFTIMVGLAAVFRPL
jgi:MFS family permease